jgi:hypothetical protein
MAAAPGACRGACGRMEARARGAREEPSLRPSAALSSGHRSSGTRRAGVKPRTTPGPRSRLRRRDRLQPGRRQPGGAEGGHGRRSPRVGTPVSGDDRGVARRAAHPIPARSNFSRGNLMIWLVREAARRLGAATTPKSWSCTIRETRRQRHRLGAGKASPGTRASAEGRLVLGARGEIGARPPGAQPASSAAARPATAPACSVLFAARGERLEGAPLSQTRTTSPAAHARSGLARGDRRASTASSGCWRPRR